MWKKPWKMKEGFCIGGGLLLLGLLLQLVLGPIEWSHFAWPVNIIVLACLLVLLGAVFAPRGRVHAFEWMMPLGAAGPALVYCRLF